ncbi:hypothetical protein IC175_11420 [Clostridioides sp. ES-S-0123-01]|uniref:hypothetical protein n=1 Tax=Clostridioides sp. ES-S-0123-01 TaxID=2770783 RepID=UPI001D10DD27|nr:hypothetical protein [Clostridioides sp. ES-S-0123-01]
MLLKEEIELNLEPSDLINSKPHKSEYSDLCGLDANFIKEELLKAKNIEYNKSLICHHIATISCNLVANYFIYS